MEYYVLSIDAEFDCIIEDEIPSKFSGISMNLGMSFDHLPEISLTLKDEYTKNNIRCTCFESCKLRQ
jgi:hypothetical protein